MLACKYLCQSVISKTDLDIADGLLLKLYKSVETLYRKHVITPNMHLHKHLKEVILDHGLEWGAVCKFIIYYHFGRFCDDMSFYL